MTVTPESSLTYSLTDSLCARMVTAAADRCALSCGLVRTGGRVGIPTQYTAVCRTICFFQNGHGKERLRQLLIDEPLHRRSIHRNPSLPALSGDERPSYR